MVRVPVRHSRVPDEKSHAKPQSRKGKTENRFYKTLASDLSLLRVSVVNSRCPAFFSYAVPSLRIVHFCRRFFRPVFSWRLGVFA
jgi:hypothetical protein